MWVVKVIPGICMCVYMYIFAGYPLYLILCILSCCISKKINNNMQLKWQEEVTLNYLCWNICFLFFFCCSYCFILFSFSFVGFRISETPTGLRVCVRMSNFTSILTFSNETNPQMKRHLLWRGPTKRRIKIIFKLRTFSYYNQWHHNVGYFCM